jgi:Peptidase family M13
MSDSGRPGAGKRHGASWTGRVHHKHGKKHNINVSEQEVAPLLASENNDDLEGQSYQDHHHHEQQPTRRDSLKKCAKVVLNGMRKKSTPILAGLAIVLSMTVVGLGLGWAIEHKAFHRPDMSFCLSGKCTDAAIQIFNNLAPNYTEIDPCTNFEEYACGGFSKHHQLRPDQSSLMTLTIMAEENQHKLRQVLEKKPTDIKSRDRINFMKLKADYDACMDEKTIQSYGLTPLRSIVEQVKEKYPVESVLRPVRNSMSQLNIRPVVKDISDVVAYMTRIGVENVMQLYVGVS